MWQVTICRTATIWADQAENPRGAARRAGFFRYFGLSECRKRAAQLTRWC
jgi:hypothetical protein